MMRLLLSLLSVSIWVGPCLADDLDGDGLDDQQIEQVLLDRHRPHLVFMPGERYKPVSIYGLVSHSDLVLVFPPNGCGIIHAIGCYSAAQVAVNPLLVLMGREGNPTQCFADQSSFVISPNPPVRYRLNIDDAYRAPNSNIPAFFNGTYGHVTPVGGGRILVQYWLLFPMNEAECVSDCGDHEGDWLYLDVYVSDAPPYQLQSIVYHHHGDGNCEPVTLPYAGVPFGYPPMGLPPDGHPVCYIEEQAHEWWPWPSIGGECEFGPAFCENASHNGGGLSYTVQLVKNVGEWYAPMPDVESQIFILYNGLWGYWASECFGHTFEPPDSPMVQFFPSPPNWRFLSHGEPLNVTGSGTATNPWRTFAAAASQIESGKTLHIVSGNYSAVGTWNTPMTLTATLGPVTLGR